MNDITPLELKQRLQQKEKLNIFDVREAWEYEEANIGAQLIPLTSIPKYLDHLKPLKDQEIIVHCQSGRRSHQAKKFLSKHGFSNVRSLEGGLLNFMNQAD